MPQCKALKTFDSGAKKYGFIRAGSRFSCEPNYALDLRRNGLIEILDDQMQPSRVQAFDGAPAIQGKVPTLMPPQAPDDDTAVQPDAGEVRQSQSSRAVRASLRPTAHTSKGNAKP